MAVCCNAAPAAGQCGTGRGASSGDPDARGGLTVDIIRIHSVDGAWPAYLTGLGRSLDKY